MTAKVVNTLPEGPEWIYEDLTQLPLEARRSHLPNVVQNSGVLISQELPGTAQQVIAAVRRLGLEGVIAKRKHSPYQAQRSDAWVKLKLDRQQEFKAAREVRRET